MKQKSALEKGVREAVAYRNEPERMRLIAGYFWLATLSLSVAAAFLGAGYGAWVFWSVFKGAGDSAPAAIGPTPFTRAQLNAAVERFIERADRYETFSDHPPVLPEPR